MCDNKCMKNEELGVCWRGLWVGNEELELEKYVVELGIGLGELGYSDESGCWLVGGFV